MGTSFFWFYDVVIVAVIIGVTFRSAKKGAVGVIISTAASIIAFLLAYYGSAAISDTIYRRYISEPLTDSITELVSDSFGDTLFLDFEKIDMSKAVAGGKFLGNIEPKFDSTGKMTLDLSSIDLTETGIEEADLTAFGIDENYDYSNVKLGSIEIKEKELENRTLEEIVLAHILTASVRTGTAFSALESVGDLISSTLPMIFGDLGKEVSVGDGDAVYSLILGITDFSFDNYGASVISSMIDPIVKIPLRAIIFLLIFTIVLFLVNIIANASKIINRIPVIASVNELLGGVLGLVRALLIILIICISIQFLISLTDNSLVFLNTYTIDRTLIFKSVYYFDFLDMLKAYV